MERTNVRSGAARVLAWSAVIALVAVGALGLSSSGSTRASPVAPPVGAAAPLVATHPSPVPAHGGAPATVHPLTHWWFGGDYGGVARSPTSSKMTLTIPDAVPSTSEFYYVLLSTWDNAGSYDQVGISNDFGTWGWTWSYTSYCAGSYNYTPNQMALERGATYTFAMTISNGNVTFTATKGLTTVGTIVGHSGGTSFAMSGFYTCSGGATYYDYTDYEEIYSTVQSAPSFNFPFTKNVVSNGSVTNWSAFSSGAPAGPVTAFSGNTVRVENQGFSMRFLSAPDKVTVAKGTVAYVTNVTLATWFAAGNVTLSGTNLPTGMTVAFGTSPGTPPFSSTVTIGLFSVHAGTYSVNLRGTGSGGVYTYLTLRIHLL